METELIVIIIGWIILGIISYLRMVKVAYRGRLNTSRIIYSLLIAIFAPLQLVVSVYILVPLIKLFIKFINAITLSVKERDDIELEDFNEKVKNSGQEEVFNKILVYDSACKDLEEFKKFPQIVGMKDKFNKSVDKIISNINVDKELLMNKYSHFEIIADKYIGILNELKIK